MLCAAAPASGGATEREVRRLKLAAHLSMRNEWGLTCTFGSALGRIRTCDTRFRKPMLYPLSYEG